MRALISTPRLTLRFPEPRDAAALARCVADFDVARMTASIPHPYPVEVAEGWIALAAVMRRRALSYSFVTEVAGEGVRGGVGVFRRQPGADWEVGYHVAKPAWGRGIASEALAALIAWTRTELAPARLTAGHFDDNPASRRVLEKAGFVPTGRTTAMFSVARGGMVTCIDMALTLHAAEHAA